MTFSANRNPVLLIHGIDDTVQKFRRMVPYLSDRGWDVHCFNLVPNNGDVGLDRLADQITHYVQTHFSPAQPFDLIGYSMGGIVSRYYVQRLGGIDRVQRFITLASPHHGTWTAYGRGNIGAQQMRPNSQFLADLNRDVAMLEQLALSSIWTPLDLMIVPANSSELPIGKSIQIPVLLHPLMVFDRRSLDVVTDCLRQPISID